ncbi:MAG: hypothetical protein AB7G06_02185 [Bdellovibrionales bacterium]
MNATPLTVESLQTMSLEDANKRWQKFTPDVVANILALAHQIAQFSEDPSTKNCATIWTSELELVAVGINRFPEGVAQTDERMNDRAFKYPAVVHAEVSAVSAIARKGMPANLAGASGLGDCIMICTMFPCTNCLKTVHGAGIQLMISNQDSVQQGHLDPWGDEFRICKHMLNEMQNPTLAHAFHRPSADTQLAQNMVNSLHELKKLKGQSYVDLPAIDYDMLLAWGNGHAREIEPPAGKLRLVHDNRK